MEPDEKTSLANFAGYSSQKTLAPTQVKLNEVQMSVEAERGVKRVAAVVMDKIEKMRAQAEQAKESEQKKEEHQPAPAEAQAQPEEKKDAE
jgi:hypothetical protein